MSATCNLRDCIKSQDRASFCCKRNFNARCCYYASGYNNQRPNYINNYIPHNDYGPWQNLGNNHPYNSNFQKFIYRKEFNINHATYCRSLESRKARIVSSSKVSGWLFWWLLHEKCWSVLQKRLWWILSNQGQRLLSGFKWYSSSPKNRFEKSRGLQSLEKTSSQNAYLRWSSSW